MAKSNDGDCNFANVDIAAKAFEAGRLQGLEEAAQVAEGWVKLRVMVNDKATPPRNESDADECRRKGWKRGTRLVGDEGYGPTVIQITAVGDEAILAREISHNGVPVDGSEWSWTLDCRKWKEVGEGRNERSRDSTMDDRSGKENQP